MPKEKIKQLVRTDINLEKWNIVSTQRQKETRIIVRHRILPDGTKLTQKVTIKAPIESEDAKVFYLLKSLWEQQGKPQSGRVYSSLRNIFAQLFPEDSTQRKEITRYGNWYKNWFKQKIENLLGSTIIFQNAYENKDGTVREYESFTLLSQAHIFERNRRDLNQPYFDFSNFTIHPVIVQSLLEKNVKPIRLDVIMKLKSEIAFILYRWLDLVMANKTEIQKRISELANELSFGAKRIDNLVAQLKKACEELQDKDLTTGKIIYCKVEKTVDGKDWKLVVKKGKQMPVETQEEDQEDQEIQQLVRHKFVYSDPKAKSVLIAGSFNDWQPEQMGGFNNRWNIFFDLEPGKYFYKFVVDGNWICDPQNPTKERDQHGNENSVLVLGQ